jgi:ubiquitin C-terminal hydrolase
MGFILTIIKECKSKCCGGRGNEENNNEIMNKEMSYVNTYKENDEQKLKKEDGVKQNKIIKHNEITETINERNEKYEKEENIDQNEKIVQYSGNEKTEPEEIKKTNNKSQFKKDKFLLINELYSFINNGNNCYLNSSLQLLTRVKELRINILNFKYENICFDTITGGKIYIEFKNIIQDIINGKKK